MRCLATAPTGWKAMTAEIVRSFSLCVALLLCLAIAHKVRVLYGGDARREPLLAQRAWLQRHATPALATAAAVEAAVVTALLIAPPAGLAMASLLLAAYSLELRRLPADQPCNCFGAILAESSSASAIRRNLALIGLSVAALASYAATGERVAGLSQTAIGVALLLVAVPAAVSALRAVSPNHTAAAQSSERQASR